MTPTDGDLLLKAILENPAEDTPRLVYADWLEEQGHGERAEFIRVQCEIAVIAAEEAALGQKGGRKSLTEYERCTRLAWRRRELEPREQELLGEGRNYEWFMPRGTFAEACRWGFCRGFVASITCTAADWLAHADAIVAAHPIERVRLTTWAGHPEVLEDQYLEDRWPGVAFELPPD